MIRSLESVDGAFVVVADCSLEKRESLVED